MALDPFVLAYARVWVEQASLILIPVRDQGQTRRIDAVRLNTVTTVPSPDEPIQQNKENKKKKTK